MAARTDTRTAGILLAAGASRRMGTNKLLLEFEGEPLARRAARRALDAGLDPLVVVLGHEADAVKAALRGLQCLFVISEDIGGALSGSLHAGLRGLPSDTDAAVILLADMPHVTSEMLLALRHEAADGATPLVVSRYAGILAPPILFRRALFAELLHAHGDGIGRAVVAAHQEEARSLEWPEALLADVDTPQQYARMHAPRNPR